MSGIIDQYDIEREAFRRVIMGNRGGRTGKIIETRTRIRNHNAFFEF
jgi:hypothetical protein